MTHRRVGWKISFEIVAVDDTMSDDDAEADSEVEDGDEEGPPAPGDMQRRLFRDFLDWKGLVLIEPTVGADA